MAATFKTVTLGCKVNQYETLYLEEALQTAGWQRRKGESTADLVIVNTCAVTQQAVHQSRQAVRKALRENPNAVAVATGCCVQVDPDGFAQIEGLHLAAGNTFKADLPNIITAGVPKGPCRVCVGPLHRDITFERMSVRRTAGRTRAYLKIQDGCQAFCSYCIVPFARGPYRSLPEGDVLSSLAALVESGYREVILTGIHLGKYGIDQGSTHGLGRLLRAIAREKLKLRIRLSSLEPTEIDDEILDLVNREPWLCRHFHIPLQSGDAATLERMNRRYSPEMFSNLVNRIHDALPHAAIGVDVMAGFPGEDRQAHQRTLALLERLPVSYLHVFPFSRRHGTRAFDMPGQVHPAEIKRRAAEIRKLGARKRAAFYARCVGQTVEVLAERRDAGGSDLLQGTSDNYLPLFFRDAQALPGRLLQIRVQEADEKKVWGRVVTTGDAAA